MITLVIGCDVTKNIVITLLFFYNYSIRSSINFRSDISFLRTLMSKISVVYL
jgi:hypothetical protein